MDFLFIHGNYPAQFRHLVPLLAQAGHRVVFLTNRQDTDSSGMKGVTVCKYETHRSTSAGVHKYLQSSEEAVLQGQAVLREIKKLTESGFQPRFVITHGGMGIGLFIKDFLPQSIHIGYFEWYFQPSTTRYLTNVFDLDMQLTSKLRNLPILYELENCDIAVVPTEWQKQQFPIEYQKKLTVVFDGIDRQFFKQKPNLDGNKFATSLRNRDTGELFKINAEEKVISYATRGMETLRGFPEFMRALPSLFEKYDDLKVVIAGADKRAYSYDAPSNGGSWKKHMLEELENQLPMHRIIFTGLLDYQDYRNLLWRSDLHCYFTRPYVTSWSFFESAACGAQLAVSKNNSTRNIVDEKSVIWVNLDDQTDVNNKLSKGLEKEREQSKLLPGFDLTTSLQMWQKLLNDALQNN